MKLLQFIREITDSDEEFLAVIKEMNIWIKGEGNAENNKSLYVPNYNGRLNFTRKEHRDALERATKTLRQQKTYRDYKSIFASNRTRENLSDSSLFR